jgi:iron complex outermembrane receptor protein
VSAGQIVRDQPGVKEQVGVYLDESVVSLSLAEVSVGGIVSGLRLLKTRKGDRMAVFSLDDPQGSVEVVVFPEAFSKSSSVHRVPLCRSG